MDKLILLNNDQIKFELNGSTYMIPRKDIELRFKLYWMKAALYDDIIELVKEYPNWFKKYKS